MKAAFTGGGSLDGGQLELPWSPPPGVVTEPGRSWYVLNDDVYLYAGNGEIGGAMAGIWRQLTAAAKAEREAVEAASAAQGCGTCGRTFANAAAKAVHADHGTCLPDGAYGQLVQVDGVWDSAWRHPDPQSISRRRS